MVFSSPSTHDSAPVEEVAVEMRCADEGGDPFRLRSDRLEGLLGGAEEARPEEEVLGRIAGDRELGEEDELGAGLRASPRRSTMRARLPSRSPTTVFICASASRTLWILAVCV